VIVVVYSSVICCASATANAYIIVPPRNTTGLEGSRIRLDCEAAASPANITYQWFHNGVDVRLVPGLMSRAQIATDGALVIVRALRDDTGWYRCRPTNGIGRPPDAEAYLNVTCKYHVISGCYKYNVDHKNVPICFRPAFLRRFFYFYTTGKRNEYSTVI